MQWNGEIMTTKLADILENPEQAKEVPAEAIPPLLTQLAAAQSALAARLLSFVPDQSDGGRTTHEQAEQLMTVADASKRLAFKPAYLYELIRQGRFPVVRQGKYIRIRVADLQGWIQQHQNIPLDKM